LPAGKSLSKITAQGSEAILAQYYKPFRNRETQYKSITKKYMLTKEQIASQISHCLAGTNFTNLGTRYEGKVRDNYTKDEKRILITTDRLSAFDKVIALVPFKGQALNALSKFWFERTKDIVGNHVVEYPDPNAVVGEECTPLAVEMVVRGYITGSTTTSAWYNYQKGVRNFCGNPLPEGMKKDQKLDHAIITPTTKAAHGDHDESLAPEELIKRGHITKDDWDKLAAISLKLFARGQEIAAKQGIILVDTKYEFGKNKKGEIVLIDEIHTPDSSRFWKSATYQAKFDKGEDQDNINKEYLRLWLSEKGFIGEGAIPAIPEDVIVETARRYIEAYELITGQTFEGTPGDPLPRIEKNLAKYMS